MLGLKTFPTSADSRAENSLQPSLKRYRETFRVPCIEIFRKQNAPRSRYCNDGKLWNGSMQKGYYSRCFFNFEHRTSAAGKSQPISGWCNLLHSQRRILEKVLFVLLVECNFNRFPIRKRDNKLIFRESMLIIN